MKEVNGVKIYDSIEECTEVQGKLPKNVVFPYGVKIIEKDGVLSYEGLTKERKIEIVSKAGYEIKPDGSWSECWLGQDCIRNGCECKCDVVYIAPDEITCYCPCD